MANNNPVGVVRDLNSGRNNSRLAHHIVGRVTGGGTHAVTVETKLGSILSAVCVNETDAALLATTIAASTANPGTMKVTFTVAVSKTYSFTIIGFYGSERAVTVDTTGGATTITYEPIKGM